MISLAKFIIKSLIAFSISFVVLSIPIGGDTVFERVSEYVRPFDDDFVDKTKEAVEVSLETTREIGKQFIKNTTPKVYKKSRIEHVKGNALTEDAKPRKVQKKGPTKKVRPDSYNDSDKRKLDTLFN